MSRLMSRPVRIGKYSIPALLLLALAVGSVAATAYVILQFTATVTVQSNPKVSFYEWATLSKRNTFNYAFNIFPSVKTVEENATHGIFCDDTVSHTCYLRISGITNSANVQIAYVKVYNATNTIVTITWNNGESLPQSWTMFTAGAGKKYSIWMEVTATAGATVGQSSVITVDMKVEQP